MKKVIIISIVFAITLGVGIWEIVYSTKVFNDLHDAVDKVEESIYASGKEIDNANTLSLMDDVEDIWEDSKEILFCLNNHTVLRTLDEKITSLRVMIEINHVEDAKVMVEVTKVFLKAISNDTHPVSTNLF